MVVLLSLKKWLDKKFRLPVESATVQDILDWSLREPDIECFQIVKDYLYFKAKEDTDLWGGFDQWFGFARAKNEDIVIYMIAKSMIKVLGENSSNDTRLNLNHKRLKKYQKVLYITSKNYKEDKYLKEVYERIEEIKNSRKEKEK